MELTQNLIQDCLKKAGAEPVAFGRPAKEALARPVIYPGDDIPGQHLMLLAERAEAGGVLPRGCYITAEPGWEQALDRGSSLLYVPGTDALRLLNLLQSIYDHFDRWDEGITRIMEKEQSYHDLVNLCALFTGGSFSIVDYDFNFVAYSDNMSEYVVENRMKVEDVSFHLANAQFELVQQATDVFRYRFQDALLLGYNFNRNGVYMGRMVMSPGPYLCIEAAEYLLRHVAKRVEAMIDRHGSFMRLDRGKQSVRLLLNRLLDGEGVKVEELEEALRPVGWLPNHHYLLIRMSPEFRHERALHSGYFAGLIESRWSNTAVSEFEDYIVVLVNVTRMPDRHDIREELSGFLAENLMLAAFSREFRTIGRAAAAYRQAVIAFRIGHEIDSTRWLLRFDDYALEHWLKNGYEGFEPEEICSPALLLLRDHDREKGTDYCNTLKVLFDSGFNYSQAANSLYIHRTTLINRVARMTELSGINPENPDQRLYLRLSMYYLDKHQ